MKKVMILLVVCSFLISSCSAIIVVADPVRPPNPTEGEVCAWNTTNCLDPYVITHVNLYDTGNSIGTDINRPIIKCKWEYDLSVKISIDECDEPCPACTGHSEGYWEHDACCCIDGLQVKPIPGGDVQIGFYAVVTDNNGVEDIQDVYADVWHPDGQFKYEVVLTPILDPAIAVQMWDHVMECHEDLVTENTVWANTDHGVDENNDPITWQDDVRDELLEGLAYLYQATEVINYCQPGGWYKVGYIATDGILDSEMLENFFWYIPTAAIELDFDEMTWTDVKLDVAKTIGGDNQMVYNLPPDEVKPTVKNIGNTPVELYVWQDDTGFGYTGNFPGWDLVDIPFSAWNVKYKAQLTASSTGNTGWYYPYDTDTDKLGVRIPGVLPLCSQEKLDFTIMVMKDPGFPVYTGELNICAYSNGVPSYLTPSQFIGSGFPQIY
jgi:hypothetical protein